MTSKAKIEIRVLHGDNRVALYGNQAFFQHLRLEIDRFLASSDDDYCEFQLQSIYPPTNQEIDPQCIVRRTVDGLDESTKVALENYDLVLMKVPQSDLDQWIELPHSHP